jgi:hypothetical protein
MRGLTTECILHQNGVYWRLNDALPVSARIDFERLQSKVQAHDGQETRKLWAGTGQQLFYHLRVHIKISLSRGAWMAQKPCMQRTE